MKICMLAPEFLPVWGGVGAYIVELVRHLPKETEIHVLTPWRTCLGSSAISTSDYDFSQYFGHNVRVHFISKASDTFVYNFSFQYACSRVVPKLVKEEGIDLVHSHTAHMSDLLLQFRKMKIPIVATIHTTIEGQREGAKNSGLPFSSLEASERWTYLTYPFLRLADTTYFLKRRNYITVSNWMKNQVEKKYPLLKNSIKVVHNAIDTTRFTPGRRRSERKTVLFTGRLISAKGIRHIVDAIPTVLRSFPETFFLFIGSGDASPYERKLRDLEIPRDNYKFLGYLKESTDLVEHYQTASIYVAPTLYENLPTRVLEAMACGTPVISSNVCGIPEAVHDGENGLLVQPGSTKQLADGICCLLGDSDYLLKMGQNARATILNEFDWRVSAAKISDIYQQVVSS
ncbi:MAG TPA: glycosyltransferase family 4 protein [Candidatus Bathyarchaeia archaeon]|nr:glycosyltransferase family 4 protein [Candidatus Bathyarchaeia archaeon]